MIDRCDVPLLGVNTDPGRSLGILCSKFLYRDRAASKYIHRIFSQLEDEKFNFVSRERLNCRITPQAKSGQVREPVDMLSLNEVFIAEKDASKISSYKLNADGIDLGSFKSSGIIISTGTGSSGWLYGAKRATAKTVQNIAKELAALQRD